MLESLKRILEDLPGGTYALLSVLLILLLVAWLMYRGSRRRGGTVADVVRRISHDYQQNLILPKADEGEIYLDHLLLTSEGLLVIDIKDVEGIVFGSDKMQDWTVIARDRRFTFANPQPGMFDRIAAVRQIARDVPVHGRIVFLPGAEFTKGVPGLVCQLKELAEEFSEADKQGAAAKVESFKPHWEKILSAARQADTGRSRRVRGLGLGG